MSYRQLNHTLPASQNLTTRLVIMALAAMIVPLAGCNIIRSFDETAALTYRDLVWSKRAYNLRYGNCDRPYSEHFKNGFCSGYEEVCGGGDGFTPALPPETYRGYEYQSSDGSKCVDAWFEGYPAGVAAARKDNSGSYHDVAISRMIEAAIKQEEKKPELSGEVPVVPGKDARQPGSDQANSDYQAPPSPVAFAQPSMSLHQPVLPTPTQGVPSVQPLGNGSPRGMTPPILPAGFNLPPNVQDETQIPVISAADWNAK